MSALDLAVGGALVFGLAWLLWWYLRRRKKLAPKPAPEK